MPFGHNRWARAAGIAELMPYFRASKLAADTTARGPVPMITGLPLSPGLRATSNEA